jgi:hypothetical protein
MPPSSSCVTIIVQPYCGLWETFERPGIQPLFRSRESAVSAARTLLTDRIGVIEIRDPSGLVDHVIDLRSPEAEGRAA